MIHTRASDDIFTFTSIDAIQVIDACIVASNSDCVITVISVNRTLVVDA
ncbi:hypothetical protein [Nostoc sp. FACHB-145]|nr:hypothetical protein [Nostoc sp. FACHB-145]MBD2473093.1 hypothetical protein [Nostoc sp. FACHB-145]